MNKNSDCKNVFLASPRGFCAGVKRAIALVEQSLQDYGVPIYVRHEIVHNKHVVESLKNKGVVFIEDFSEIKDISRPVIISAHGAGKNIFQEAQKLGLNLIDATCPLVKKVHKQIERYEQEHKKIIFIGQKEHPETIGTLGQLNFPKQVDVIYSEEEAKALQLSADADIGTVNQTTLSVNKLQKITDILRERFGNLETLNQNDICYATTHRQNAVKKVAENAELFIIIGSKNSSNSRQLQKCALDCGAKQAWLVDDASEINWEELSSYQNIGISAGASAPEHLVEELLQELKKHYENLKIHDIIVADERVVFKI